MKSHHAIHRIVAVSVLAWMFCFIHAQDCPDLHLSVNGPMQLCYHASDTIRVAVGDTVTCTFQWQDSIPGGTWDSIHAGGDTAYYPIALAAPGSYYYRCIVSPVYFSECPSDTSDIISVLVYDTIMGGTIEGMDTVCMNGTPHPMIQTVRPMGGDGVYTYQWQELVGNLWQDIDGKTDTICQIGSLSATTKYRLVAFNACQDSIMSNEIEVYVRRPLSITTHSVAPLCYMDQGTISVSATGAGDDYAYQWQDSINGQWTDVPSAGNASQYQTDPKEGGDYFYRCIVIPVVGCHSDTSAVIAVHVYDDFAPGRIGLVGADTICYGTEADTIKLVDLPRGGKGDYQYRWWWKPASASTFTPISSAKKTFYVPGALYETTEYTLEVTDGCGGSLFTDTVRIYVRDALHKPVLAKYPDTICYNTIPDPIVIEKLATGGVDDSFTYQWYSKSKDDYTFTPIPGETDTIYQPQEPLVKKTYYQVRAISAKCGNVLISDNIAVNVYDSLHITAVNPEPLCYMESATLSVNVTGEGNDYRYQWQDSISGGTWQNVPADGQKQVYVTGQKTDGDYYYRCIVSANKCENVSRISPIIAVSVYEALHPGTISGIDSTCYGYAPDYPLSVDVPATGVDGHYTYQWQVFKDGQWIKTRDKDTTETYQPDPLFEDAAYRLLVSSKCETYATDSILIRVNPLPEKQAISGANDVCYHRYERYTVETLNPGYTYEWNLKNGHGTLPDDRVNTPSIEVFWNDPLCTDSVLLVVTNNVTGCVDTMKYGVSICDEAAPDTTIIVRKKNTNILVCQAGQGEEDKYLYQWGYTDRATQIDAPLNSDHRYVYVENFDEMRYTYWVELRHNIPNPKCFSRSHYNADNDSLISEPSNNVSVPSYVHGNIPIAIQNADQEEVSCAIYAISGELVAVYEFGKERYMERVLPFPVSTGIYLMRVKIGDDVESIKLIAE